MRTQLNLRIPLELLSRVHRAAKKSGRSVSAWVRDALGKEAERQLRRKEKP